MNVLNFEEVKLELKEDVEAPTQVPSLKYSQDIKPNESRKVKQSKIGRGKNKGLYRKENSQYICCLCQSRYHSAQGMNNHLNTMVCGYGKQTEKRVKRSYLGLYSSVGKQFVCNGCVKRYHSIRGVHKHLETHDSCGLKSPQMIKEVKSVKKVALSKRNYKNLYIKQDGHFICLACEAYYQSSKGIHHHLTNKSFGFGEANTDKKSLQGHYVRAKGKYSCSKCSSEFAHYVGVWRHLKKCL